jgi:hypothetical protein
LPPSTVTICPVTNDAASDARNTIARHIVRLADAPERHDRGEQGLLLWRAGEAVEHAGVGRKRLYKLVGMPARHETERDAGVIGRTQSTPRRQPGTNNKAGYKRCEISTAPQQTRKRDDGIDASCTTQE